MSAAVLGETLLEAFPSLDAEERAGETVLAGALPDQAALYGVLTGSRRSVSSCSRSAGPGPEPRRPIVPFVRRRLVLRGATLLPMFTEGRLAMALSTRELAYRRDGGIEVALLWNTVTGRLTVTVADLASDEAFQLPVAPDRALDGFYHPYAYAASMGVVYGDAPLHALYA